MSMFYNLIMRNKGDDYRIENGMLVWANPNLYLEAFGNEWINTGIKTANNLIVDVEYYRVDGQIFGWAGTISGVIKTFGYASSSAAAFARIGSWYVANNSAVENEKWLTFHFERGIDKATINGVKFSSQSGSQNTFSDGGNIGLFVYRNLSTETPMIGKIKYFKISQGEDVIMHLVPVPAGLVIGEFIVPSNGMFDIVTQTFFGNSGTGSFGYGKVI